MKQPQKHSQSKGIRESQAADEEPNRNRREGEREREENKQRSSIEAAGISSRSPDPLHELLYKQMLSPATTTCID